MNQNTHLDTVQDQKLMSDGPVLKHKIRDISNDPLTRERLINTQIVIPEGSYDPSP